MERLSEESTDISIENCNWLALYCIVCVFSFKISELVITKAHNLFNFAIVLV